MNPVFGKIARIAAHEHRSTFRTVRRPLSRPPPFVAGVPRRQFLSPDLGGAAAGHLLAGRSKPAVRQAVSHLVPRHGAGLYGAGLARRRRQLLAATDLDGSGARTTVARFSDADRDDSCFRRFDQQPDQPVDHRHRRQQHPAAAQLGVTGSRAGLFPVGGFVVGQLLVSDQLGGEARPTARQLVRIDRAAA